MVNDELSEAHVRIGFLEEKLRQAEERAKILNEKYLPMYQEAVHQNRRLKGALTVIESKATDFIEALDRYNEKHGEFIGGAPIFQLARAVGEARLALNVHKRSRALQDKQSFPPSFSQDKIEQMIDNICGCEGCYDCNCVSIFNQAKIEAWAEHNS